MFLGVTRTNPFFAKYLATSLLETEVDGVFALRNITDKARIQTQDFQGVGPTLQSDLFRE